MKHDYPEVMTEDGEPFDFDKLYYFFDTYREQVRDTAHLRRIDADSLGSMGAKIIAIEKLRASRDDAINDAQKFYLGEIERLRQTVRRLESEKTPKSRSLKAVLMAQG
jgi:hypothetical protein